MKNHNKMIFNQQKMLLESRRQLKRKEDGAIKIRLIILNFT